MEHYILKGVTDALFLYFETSTYRIANKNNAGVTATGCIIYYSVVCCEGALCYPQKHTLRVYYILLRGCLLCLFFAKAVEGLEVEQTEVKHPRFLYVGNKRHNMSEAGCSQTTI